MNDYQKLKYFDKLFTSGGNIVPGATLDWLRVNNVTYQNVTIDDYFQVLLAMVGMVKNDLTPRQYRAFKNNLWKGVEWEPELLRVGQVVRLYNKRFTGNKYVITKITPTGFDVHNKAMPRYKFKDLDFSSIDKILKL